MPRMSLGGGGRTGSVSSADSAAAPAAKRRRFFSAAHLPPLPVTLAKPPTPPRSVASDRVLAALQTDERVVVAAKTFVKEKMGDDKWELKDKTRVTRGVSTATAIANGLPPAKRHAGGASSTPAPVPVPVHAPATAPAPTGTTTRAPVHASTPKSKPPASASKLPSPRKPATKAQPKRLAIGSAAGSIAQRIKAKGAQVARKITLRSRAPPAPPPAPAAVQPPQPRSQPTAGPSRLRQITVPKDLDVSDDAGTDTEEEDDEDEEAEDDEEEEEAYEPNPGKRKEYLESGLYCQDEAPSEDLMLVNRVLAYRSQPKKRNTGRALRSSLPATQSQLAPIPTPEGEPVSFPPLPLEYHYKVLFGGEQHEFQLPYNIMWESESGALDGKKRPPFFQKIRTNQFIERSKYPAGERVVCYCDPTYGCGDNCINVIMSYLCGTECPCGDRCGNKSLARRKGKATRVQWTGSRGFGLFAAEDIKEGEFVTDYRGEIIHINTFIERIGSTYKGKRNFYALAYDRDEVIDAGVRGNDTRFINHGCNPNLDVRKYSTLGDGYDEYEVGMWAKRDIKAGEELFYNYNFDSFAVMVNRDDERERCMCGAPNCVGFLGRKQGERSAKVLAADMAREASGASRKGKGKRASSSVSKRTSTPMSAATSSAVSKATSTPVSASTSAPTPVEQPAAASRGRGRGRASAVEAAAEPTPVSASEPVNGATRRSLSRTRNRVMEPKLAATAPADQSASARPQAAAQVTPAHSSGRLTRGVPRRASGRVPVAVEPSAPAELATEAEAAPSRLPVGATPTQSNGTLASSDGLASSGTHAVNGTHASASAMASPATPAADMAGSPASGSSTTAAPQNPLKRPRGRPPKPRFPEGQKRPRGRPRIHPLPNPDVPTRPRGRPRLHPRPNDLGSGSAGASGSSTAEPGPLTPESLCETAAPTDQRPQAMFSASASSPLVKPEPMSSPRIKREFTSPAAATSPLPDRGRVRTVRPAPYTVPTPAERAKRPNGFVHQVQHASSSQQNDAGSSSRNSLLSAMSAVGAAAQNVSSSMSSLKLKFTMPKVGAAANEAVPSSSVPAQPAAPASSDSATAAAPSTPQPKTSRQAKVLKRNGAPAGWVYVPVGAPPPPPPEAPPSARAQRLARRAH